MFKRDIYSKIRKENEKKYGTDVGRYGKTLLANLYSDKTHFIYEILQNAEDACERRRIEEGQTRKFKISFELYKDRLEIRHNGIAFSDDDVCGICGIVEGTKNNDPSQIGKFGIGFKSVYAYTKSPIIHSGNKHFRIQDYVFPFPESLVPDLGDETLIVIPFNREDQMPDDAFSEIEKKLGNLGLRTLLFLNNLEEISWKTGERVGRYTKETKERGDAKEISLEYLENISNLRLKENFLLFKKNVNDDRGNFKEIAVAYKLEKDPKTGKENIQRIEDAKLFVYFATERETHLKFLIHGPYITTPSRDNIKNEEPWNMVLINETASLVADSIIRIKEMGLLDVGFLEVLPIEDFFRNVETTFKPIYDAVKDCLQRHPLLPTYDGSYCDATKAYLARGKDLRALLNTEQLKQLFKKEHDCNWLDESISVDRTPDLRNYLMKELKVIEVDPERFAKELNLDFISQQSDEWVVKFYTFLQSHEALWRKRSFSIEEGILRRKPIIRLSDGSHSSPFDESGCPLVYLPASIPETGIFKIVKPTIANDANARNFLKNLGIIEPDETDVVLKKILPNYDNPELLNDEMERRFLSYISKALDNSKRIAELKDALSSKPILLAKNSTGISWFKAPKDIFLGKNYTDDETLEIFYDGNPEAWFLDEKYKYFIDSDGKPILTIEKLKQLGCKCHIEVCVRKPNPYGYVVVFDGHGNHVRGLNGFDPGCQIMGLDYALENITLEKAKIIWQLAKEYARSIRGTLEKSSRIDWSSSEKYETDSKMGKLLKEYRWIPDSKCNFFKPSEIKLDEIHPSLDSKSIEASLLAEKLEMKTIEEELLLEKLSTRKRDLFKKLFSLPEEKLEKLNEYYEKLVSETNSHQKAIGLIDKFDEKLVTPRASSEDTPKTWRSVLPEESEKILEKTRSDLVKSLENGVNITRVSEVTSPISRQYSREIKQFLLEQYDGHCQICNQRLDLGSDKSPYFEVLHLFEPREIGNLADEPFNVICLCPNCHALAKYGGKDFLNVKVKALEVIKGNAASEEVNERRGNFFPINVWLAGKEVIIYYSEVHMYKLCAFFDLEKTETNYISSTYTNPLLAKRAAARLYDEGVNLREKRQYQEALSKFRAAFEKDPSNYEYLFNIFQCLYLLKSSNINVEIYKEIKNIIEKNPAEKILWITIAQIFLTNENLENTVNYITKLLDEYNIKKKTFLKWIEDFNKNKYDYKLESLYKKLEEKLLFINKVENNRIVVPIGGPRLNICPECNIKMYPIRGISHGDIIVRYVCPRCGYKQS